MIRTFVRVLAGPDPASTWRWHSRPERQAAYAALAAATAALCLLNLTQVHRIEGAGSSPGQKLLALAVVLPLPLAARNPMLAWRAGWLGLLLSPLVSTAWWGGWPWSPEQIIALLGAFCLAAVRQRRAVLWLMWALTLIPWWLWLAKDVPDLNGPVGATVVFTAVAIAVDSVGSRLRAQRALLAQTERTELEQARRAVLEERTRIARELHDVVAHHMSLIAVRAETAPYRLSGLPAEVQAEFSSLSETARESMAEMRRLLGVLRDDRAGLVLSPQPGLGDLPGLVDAARRAGVGVELSVPVGMDEVPSGVALCVYRIAQESLSNASQHAPGAPVTMSVDRDADAVLLRVANGPGAGDPGLVPGPGPGHGPGPGPGYGPGHGLTGMRERVALLGGSLTVGPAPDGGFVVAAVLPLPVPASEGVA